MPAQTPGTAALLRWISRALEPRTRRTLTLATALAAAAHGSALVLAVLLADSRLTGASVAAAVSSALFLAQRGVTSVARTRVTADLYVASTASLLHADVMGPLSLDPYVALGEGVFNATAATTTLCLAGGQALAAFAAFVLLALRCPPRFLAAAVGAVIVIGALTLVFRRRLAAIHERSTRAFDALVDISYATVGARLEIVAHAEESANLGEVRARAAAYGRTATRAGVEAAFFSRVPLVLGVLVGAAIFVGLHDEGLPSWSKDLRAAALPIAALPSIVSLIFEGHELLRLRARLAPHALLVLGGSPPLEAAAVSTLTELPPVRFDQVSFRYGADKSTALEGVSRSWPGELLVLRGKNGAGKSTALRLLIGLRAPTAGRITVGGQDLVRTARGALRSRVGFLPQRPFLGEATMTVEAAFRLMVPATTATAFSDALARVGLADVPLDRRIGHLSIGQRQRVAIARVLARNADMLLLDEPDANLDAEGIDRLVAIIEQEVAAGKMVAIAAHGPIAERLHGTVWDL